MVLQAVIDENPEVVESARKNIKIIQPFARREIDEDDVRFIAIHILAAIEKRRNQDMQLRVMIACTGGIGTSQYLAERIQNHFDFKIVDVVSAHNARSIDPARADLLISTVPLPTMDIETVCVSPLLNDEDYVKIVNKADQVRSHLKYDQKQMPGISQANELYQQIEPVITELGGEQAETIKKKLRKILRTYFKEPAARETDLFTPYLHHLLPPTWIQLDLEASDWKEAVRLSAAPLIEKNFIESCYVDAMIHNIEEYGPYIVLTPGFAVPHDNPDSGAIRTGMNLIRLKHPVNFHHEENDPVRYVCCLSAIDHKTHLKAFFNLVNMLQNPSFLEELDKAKDPQEASTVIERFEYALQ